MKYRKKPVEIEVFQWDGSLDNNIINIAATPEWFKMAYRQGAVCFGHEDSVGNAHLLINTLEGQMNVAPGDFIIQGVKGEIYPCKPDIFEMTYERVKGNEHGK